MLESQMNFPRNKLSRASFSPESRVLLYCARTQLDSESSGIVRSLLEDGIDWDHLYKSAYHHGVIPLLYQHLRTSYSTIVPITALRQFQRKFHSWGMRIHLLARELIELLNAFSAKGIAAMPFKGPVLAAAAYRHPTLRKPGDLDILVHRHEFARARDVLIGRGYRPDEVQPAEEESFLRKRKGVAFRSGKFTVDLQYTLEQKQFDTFPFYLGLDDQMWERCISVSLAGSTVPTLSMEDQLLFLCSHGTKHSWERLYLLCDIAELVRVSQSIDWQWIVHHARELHNERLLYLGLLLAKELLDACIPEEVLQEIQSDPKVRSLALQVSRWLFNPAIDSRNPLRQHLFRLMTRRRLQDKAYYVFHRFQRVCASKLQALPSGPPDGYPEGRHVVLAQRFRYANRRKMTEQDLLRVENDAAA